MFEFRNLEVYKKAKAFHIECKTYIRQHKLDPYVKNQLGRASFSVPLNIAEGSGKFSKRDRRNFFVTSRGSVFECVAIFDSLNDDQLLTADQFQAYLLQADELSRMLYVMIKNLE